MKTTAPLRRIAVFLGFIGLAVLANGAPAQPAGGTSGSSKAAPLRLAIVSAEPSALPVLDLLTVELSRAPGIQLLERAEIDRVYREQGLSAVNRDYLKLGQVLGANGLVLLTPVAEGTNRFLQARLIAVGPGVVIAYVRAPLPVPEPAQWAQRTARHFEPLLPKLSVLAKDAIPLSIVNLRSAVRSAEAEELERQLTPLAAERLSREHELFVLERQRMELLTSEKELREGSEAAFWNGGYLVDGVVDRDGYSKETVTVSARLLPPKGGAPVPIEVSGSRTNLSEVLSRLTDKVRQGLKLGAQRAAWDPAEEAARYFEEAKWAFKWGMLGEAQSACESSWALGRQTKEVAALRINIYGAQASLTYLRSIRHPSFLENTPRTERIKPATRALELYQQAFHAYLERESKPDPEWYLLALRLLGSELLPEFNDHLESCTGHEPELATLRSLCRSTAALLEGCPLYTNLTPSMRIFRLGASDGFLALPGVPPGGGVVDFGAAYWCETPEECLEIYRQAADLDFIRAHRLQFAYHSVTGWTQADKNRGPALWRSFTDELCRSPDPAMRIEGLFLAFADADLSQQEERAKKLFEACIEYAGGLKKPGPALEEARIMNLVSWGSGQQRFYYDLTGLFATPPRGFDANNNWRISQAFIRFRNDLDKAYEAALRDRRLQIMTNYVAALASTNANPTSPEFKNVLDPSTYQKSDAAALIPLLVKLQSVLRERETSDVNARLNRAADVLLAHMESLVAPTNRTATGARTSNPPTTPASSKPTITRQTPSQIPSVANVSTNSIRVTRFWPWPQVLGPEDGLGLGVSGICFREGRVWMEVLSTIDRLFLHKAFILGIDPGSGSIQVLELPFLNRASTGGESLGTAYPFEVWRDQLFVSIRGGIKRYSFRNQTWDDLSVPTSGRLTVLDGRLFAATDDTIAELSTDGNSQTLLASARRRPPTTILDSLEHYGERFYQPPIFRGPGGAVTTRIHDVLYTLNAQKADWAELAELPQVPTSASKTSTEPQNVFLYATAEWRTNRLLLPGDQGSIAMWQPQPQCMSRKGYSLREVEAEDPLWSEPAMRGSAGMRVYLSQSKTWVFFNRRLTARSGVGPPVAPSPRNSARRDDRLLLQALWSDAGGLLGIPLELVSKYGDNPSVLWVSTTSGPEGREEVAVQRFATPAGILLINPRIGSWLLPWTDLQAALNSAKAERMAQVQVRDATVNTLWTNLLQKHHLAQKDGLTPEQKETMIDDPVFLELNLDNIDTNRNGKLDAAELAFFDANQNSQLDPPEQNAIEIAQGLLAQGLCHEYGLNHDSAIDLTDFERLLVDTDGRASGAPGDLMRDFDLNRDELLSAVELTSFLKRETLQSLSREYYFLPESPLKIVVESYWMRARNGPRGGARAGGGAPLARGLPPGARPPTSQPTNSPPRTPDEALFDAVDSGNLAAARASLDRGASVDVRDDRGWTPLILAAKTGRLEIARLLVYCPVSA